MKKFLFVLWFLIFLSVGILQAQEVKEETIQVQHQEDDVLLKFYDDKGEIISINWNGTVEYKGELDYVSGKFWELMLKVAPQLCQRNTIVSGPKEFETITMMTMKGSIVLKKDQVANKVSVIHLNTLNEHAVEFWKSVEGAFPEACK